ncbi:MAG: hypothetical protein EAZ63_03590 [Runella slithyformis]|nr:MAG: hypothetical protein EAZ63_03590 [Runella slithyformis]
MNERQKRTALMQGALSQFRPQTVGDHEERAIIRTVERHCAHIGVGPLTWLHQHWQAGLAARPVAVPARPAQTNRSAQLLACPNCGEQRFKTEKAVHGHMRVCKAKGGVAWK